MSTINMGDLPIGFGMALSRNPKAMEYFAQLPVERRHAIIEGTHQIRSKEEMHNYVNNMVNRDLL